MMTQINTLIDQLNYLRLFSACPVTANVLAAREACTLGLLKWITEPSSLIMFTSSMPGMLLTEKENI